MGFLTDALIGPMNSAPIQMVPLSRTVEYRCSLWANRSFAVDHGDIRVGKTDAVTVVEGGAFDRYLALLLVQDAQSNGQVIEEFTLRGGKSRFGSRHLIAITTRQRGELLVSHSLV